MEKTVPSSFSGMVLGFGTFRLGMRLLRRVYLSDDPDEKQL
jgi:hypothetical protein